MAEPRMLIPLSDDLAQLMTLRRAVERALAAWTVTCAGRSLGMDRHELMSEHMEALRKALGPNVEVSRRDEH